MSKLSPIEATMVRAELLGDVMPGSNDKSTDQQVKKPEFRQGISAHAYNEQLRKSIELVLAHAKDSESHAC